jgi:hypothetical protein
MTQDDHKTEDNAEAEAHRDDSQEALPKRTCFTGGCKPCMGTWLLAGLFIFIAIMDMLK